MKLTPRRTATALCFSLGLLAGAAQADPITFKLEVTFGTGPLSGQTADGWFVISESLCPAGLCSGNFISPSSGLLDFRITVDGVLFKASDDDGFAFGFPQVSLLDNELTSLDFAKTIGLPSLTLSYFGGASFGSYNPAPPPDFAVPSQVASNGITAHVPEPASALLVALGLVGVAGAARGKRRPQMAAALA